jgi:predicted nucleic acid-binding protein
MKTTLNIPEELIKTTMNFSQNRTKTGTVTEALQEYIRMKKIEKILECEGDPFALPCCRDLAVRRPIKGKTFSTVDMILAAVAQEERLLLFSLDRHFREISQYCDLSVIGLSKRNS